MNATKWYVNYMQYAFTMNHPPGVLHWIFLCALNSFVCLIFHLMSYFRVLGFLDAEEYYYTPRVMVKYTKYITCDMHRETNLMYNNFALQSSREFAW